MDVASTKNSKKQLLHEFFPVSSMGNKSRRTWLNPQLGELVTESPWTIGNGIKLFPLLVHYTKNKTERRITIWRLTSIEKRGTISTADSWRLQKAWKNGR